MKVLSTDLNKSFEDELLKDSKNKELKIAVAFFSNADFIFKALRNNTTIKLIVRLGEGTSISELKKIIKKPGVEIKYYADTMFHPKLYISGNNIYVGSANLTKNAFSKNNELTIKFTKKESENSYKQICNLFNEYWENAKTVDIAQLNDAEKLFTSQLAYKHSFSKKINNIIRPHHFKSDKIKKQNINYKSFVKGKKFAITGKLNGYTRNKVKEILEKYGAKLQTEVNSETTHFIDMIEGSNSPYAKTGTNKEFDYEYFISLGYKIDKISEQEFYKIIDNLKK